MSRRDVTWFVAMAVLTLLVAASAPAFPAEYGSPGPSAQAPAGDPPADEEAVEQILRQQEELMRGQQFGYDPGKRRDPFLSLFAEARLQDDGPRPPGARGMAISELNLDGIVQDGQGGDRAFFTGSDNKGYFMSVGQRVYDGTLIAIDARKGTVTFRQEVDDPREIKPYRDVVRKLNPTDEERQQ